VKAELGSGRGGEVRGSVRLRAEWMVVQAAVVAVERWSPEVEKKRSTEP
jgi:hypothetical protein